MKYMNFIQSSLYEAADIANGYFGNVEGKIKDDNSIHVLTEADLAIGSYIIKKLQDTFPKHNIIDEEAGVIDNSSRYTWVIDPIDGTSNFVEWLPTYGIMLWLLEDHIPIAWWISLPYFNEVVYGEKWQGVYCNDMKLNTLRDGELKNALVAYCMDWHPEEPTLTIDECHELVSLVLNIRNLRMTWCAYDTVQVLKWKYGAFLNRTSMIWDNVAQHFLTIEVGGVYTDFRGNEIDYSDCMGNTYKNYTHCFGWKELHTQIQEIMKW